MQRISVVLSFRNEAENIPELLRRLRATLQQIPNTSYELIFVNDDSTDNSLPMLKDELRKHRDIVIVNMSRRFGVSECVMAGFEVAKGDMVAYMDADLQDPPELLRTMVEKMQDERADVVFTTRLTRSGESRIKMGLTKLGYKILQSVSSVNIPFNSGDYKLLSRPVIDQLTKLKEKKPFVRGLVSWVGYKHAQVFYDREARFAGETKFPIYSKRVIYNFLDSALISFSDTPLKLMLALGGLFCMTSLALMGWILVQKFQGLTLPGWTAIMTAILAVGGLQTMMIGVLGLYVNAIYLETKSRPNFIVREVIDSSSVAAGVAGEVHPLRRRL